MIKAIAIDDEPLPLELIAAFSQQIDYIDLQKTFTKPSEAKLFLENNPVDLLFLDIQMPTLSGIDFYKNLSHEPMVIFTTAFSQYALEGFNLNAIDYLMKPFTLERFTIATAKAKKIVDSFEMLDNNNQSIIVCYDHAYYRVILQEILFIESVGNSIFIHLSTGKVIKARMSLVAMMEKLPSADFVRVHRSFIVAKNKISGVCKTELKINQQIIPIGNTYLEEMKNYFPEK